LSVWFHSWLINFVSHLLARILLRNFNKISFSNLFTINHNFFFHSLHTHSCGRCKAFMQIATNYSFCVDSRELSRQNHRDSYFIREFWNLLHLPFYIFNDDRKKLSIVVKIHLSHKSSYHSSKTTSPSWELHEFLSSSYPLPCSWTFIFMLSWKELFGIKVVLKEKVS
jgi:hypothetical protein